MTSGLKLTHSTSLTTKFGFEYSLSASLSVPIEGLILGMGSMATIKYEVESTVDDSDEKTWSRSDTVRYVAPPKTHYQVFHQVIEFGSAISSDNCEFYIKERIVQTPL